MSAFPNYSAIQAVNWSSLKDMAISPRYYRFRLANPSPSKPAYRLGNAAHCAVLEPEKFEGRYIVLAQEEIKDLAPGRGTVEGKKLIAKHPEWATDKMTSDDYQVAACKEAHPGMTFIPAAERDEAMSMRDSVYSHPVARELLRGGLAEETLQWTDDGIACKARVDYLRPDLLLDLKSTKDPSPAKFQRDAANYGYFGQAMFYHDGAVAARRVDGKIAPFIIAIRNCDDYDVAVYQLDAAAVEAGRALYRSLLRKLTDCVSADYWPGVAPELKPLQWPSWVAVATEEEESF